MKLLEKMEVPKNNCFDFLRFFATSMVIWGHCYPLLGINKKTFPYGVVAVSIFFIISGFLITASWFNTKSFWGYVKKRVLRLYPALIVVVLITFFVVCPFFSSLSFSEYFSSPYSWEYLQNIFIFKAIMGSYYVFADNAYPYIINGSLWTLTPELQCYITVAVLGLIGLLKCGVGACYIGSYVRRRAFY